MEENRMDRIEREMAEFFLGMRELREFQKETGDLIRELRESQKKTDEQLARTSEQIRELREAQKRTDEQLARTDEQLARTIRKLDNVGVSLGEMGLVQGKVAEDLFYRNVKSLFRQRNLMFADVRRNVKKKGVAEYDIVASPCKGHLRYA